MGLHAIILAGGASSRFWPLCGDDHPKYLLRPDGKRTLLELAFERAAACVPREAIRIVTNRAQADAVRRVLPDAKLCLEPARRDTAAAITLGCKAVAAVDPDGWVLVLPADTLLEPAGALCDGLRAAIAAPGAQDAIHVFGVRAARPEPAFGYIECGDSVSPGVHAVRRFVEKPGAGAGLLVQSGHLWNVGCFLFRVPTFRRELAAHLPGHSNRLRASEPGEVSADDYEGLDSISIDYGLIEKVRNLRVSVLEGSFDDIGTWDALLRHGGGGHVDSVGGVGNTAIAPGRKVAVVGESDLLVVADGDRILVMKRGAGQQVKQAAQQVGDASA